MITVRHIHEIIPYLLTEKLTLHDILKEMDYPTTGQFVIKGTEKPLTLDVPLAKQGVESNMELECILL